MAKGVRTRLLQAATAFLYFGPLLAGLDGFGLTMLPPFILLFLYWLMRLRPQYWPQTNRDWLTAAGLGQVLTLVVTQTLLVAVLFGIGRGIGGVAGHLPMQHPFLSLTVSLLALPVQALALAGKAEADPTPKASQDAAAQALAPLLAFAPEARLCAVGPALEAVLNEGDTELRLALLADALQAAPEDHGALREALAIWATEPERFAANAAPTAIRAAFRAAGHDRRILWLLLPRSIALARMLPERRDQFPDRAALADLSEGGLTGALADDHAALLAALEPNAARPSAAMSQTGLPQLIPAAGGHRMQA